MTRPHRFYFGCAVLYVTMTDAEAKDHFDRACSKYGQTYLTFDQFLSWNARRDGIEDDAEEAEEEDVVELIAGSEHLRHVLENEHSGQYGDVHLQDLSTLMSRSSRHTAATAHSKGHDLKTFKNSHKHSGLQGITKKAMEKYKMVKDALRYTTQTNNSFPKFEEDQYST